MGKGAAVAAKRSKAVVDRFKNGGKPGPGRPKGLPNKATANAREAIGRFVDGNADRLQAWLDEVAKTDGPKAAMSCFIDLIEYHVPKLARAELVGDGGGALQVVLASAKDVEL